MRKVTRQPDGQPIEARPGFFLREMGQSSLTRIGSDATTKNASTKFEALYVLSHHARSSHFEVLVPAAVRQIYSRSDSLTLEIVATV